ncbi:mitogen-activated protein kinase kinase, putative [Phytophthora infestans T30-4]|uniref:mitogen-activated protein kinase kinase n=1 Tax=Phytophthora infestans (strain T30-4) TaxID=403677 RepID=D0NS17_PHYIT|nr:mitogen-activated protein kinase kinase, putative [Phytophthora infestans T30-4]EEY63558.1 mitogen-activated protein kinase kinase, putative [Phytophthora infestans T30-4]|eukprot:XP_002898145.1 mitogen-activated protein kinase kinase, putative [Phytophthora infestans T30-4]
MLTTAASFPVRNGKGYGAQREFYRDRIGSVHGIASPNIHASVRAAAIAARRVRQFRQKHAPTLHTVLDVDNETQIREASPVQEQTGNPVKRKMKLHLSLDKLEKPELPMMILHEEPITFDDPPLVVSNGSDFGQAQPSGRSRRASSITLSMNSPEAAEFNEVAHDGPEELGKRTKRVKKLGKGAGGTVFLSLYLPTLKLVAVKEVVVYQEEDRHMVKRELHTLHDNLAAIDVNVPKTGHSDALKHHFLAGLRPRSVLCPYLVTFYGAFLKPAKCAVSVVMEFMDMGSVQDLMDANVTVSEEVLRHAAFCCITALDHMHCQRTVHRDIKPANILMNHNGEFKVADFGLAGTLAKSNSFFSDFSGTMMYMAPERISGAHYTFVSDVWSLGITLLSLATGGYPFTVDDGFFGLEEAICHDSLPPMPNRFSPVCRDFIKRMLNRDCERRVTSEEALTHPFISGYANTAAFRNFPKTWQNLGLKRAIDAEDTRAIVNLAVEYSYRYPDMVTLPPKVTGLEPAAEIPTTQDKNAFFHRFAKHLNTKPEISNSFERLAETCSVSIEYLQELFHEVRKFSRLKIYNTNISQLSCRL